MKFFEYKTNNNENLDKYKIENSSKISLNNFII